MDRKAVFEHYCKLLDDLRAESLAFQNYLISKDTYIENWDFDCAMLRCGATRAALIDSGYPYIVKWDVDFDEWGDSSCEREVQVYKEAQICGLNRCFTEATYLGTYVRHVRGYNISENYCEEMDNDRYLEKVAALGAEEEEFVISIPLYGYEYADCNGNYDTHYTPEDMMYVKKSVSPLTDRSIKVGATFLNMYGADTFDALTDFCTSLQINDLHNGNIGFISGRIVITDFGSYHCGD